MAKNGAFWPKNGESGKEGGAMLFQIMRTLPKACLIASIVLFVLSLTSAGADICYGLLKPLSALSFVAFFITNVLSRSEMDQFDADNELREEIMRKERVPNVVSLGETKGVKVHAGSAA